MEKARLTHSRPRRLTDGDDDWRPATFFRTNLQRPYHLFPSENFTWKRTAHVEKTGTWSEFSVAHNEHGLWPTEYRFALVELKSDVDRLLGSLSVMEEVVVRMRFGICGFVERGDDRLAVDTLELSLDEVGDLLRVSRERVRQVEAKALRKLRHPERRKILRPHYGEQGRFFKSVRYRQYPHDERGKFARKPFISREQEDPDEL